MMMCVMYARVCFHSHCRFALCWPCRVETTGRAKSSKALELVEQPLKWGRIKLGNSPKSKATAFIQDKVPRVDFDSVRSLGSFQVGRGTKDTVERILTSLHGYEIDGVCRALRSSFMFWALG